MANIKKIQFCILFIILLCLFPVLVINAYLSRDAKGEQWRIDEFGGVISAVVVNEHLVFESYSHKDCLCVFVSDKKTGEILWTTDELAEPYAVFDEYRVDVTVNLVSIDRSNDIIYVMIRKDLVETLFAMNVASGNVIWEYGDIWTHMW